MSKAKGDRWERNYKKGLNAQDAEDVDDVDRFGLTVEAVATWKAVRMPSSGSATTDDLPDLHVWHVDGLPHDDPNRVPEVDKEFAAEAKAFAKDGGTTLEYEEVEALRRHARETGAIPVVFVHVDYVGDFVLHVDDLHDTGSKYSLRAKRDFIDVDEPPLTFDAFVRNPYKV